jgi:transposase
LWTASTSPGSSTRRSIGSGGKITWAYKKKLSKAERKAFRSLMWEFRRDPQGLSEEKKAKPEGLFAKLPQLRTLYEIRVRFREIFDTAADRRKALRSLTGLWLDILDHFPGMEPFICTFERWQEEVLNYFEGRQTSGPWRGSRTRRG